MVTLGVALLLLELANKLDWLTGGADGLQGVVMGPLLGRFEFDLVRRASPRSTRWRCCSSAFLLLRRIVHSPFGASLKALRDNRLRADGDRPDRCDGAAGRDLHAGGRARPVRPARCWRRPPASPRSTCWTSTAAPT